MKKPLHIVFFTISLLLPYTNHTMDASSVFQDCHGSLTIQQRFEDCLETFISDIKALNKTDGRLDAATSAAAASATIREAQEHELRKVRREAIADLHKIGKDVGCLSHPNSEQLAMAYESLAWARALKQLPGGEETDETSVTQQEITQLRKELRSRLLPEKNSYYEQPHVKDDFSDDEAMSEQLGEQMKEHYERGKRRHSSITAIRTDFEHALDALSEVRDATQKLTTERIDHIRSFEYEKGQIEEQEKGANAVQKILLRGQLESISALHQAKIDAIDLQLEALKETKNARIARRDMLERSGLLQKTKILIRRQQLEKIQGKIDERLLEEESKVVATKQELSQAEGELATCYSDSRKQELKGAVSAKKVTLSEQQTTLAILGQQQKDVAYKIGNISHERSRARQYLIDYGILNS